MNTGLQPLVSICIAAYNVEKYVADCLRSILGQSYSNIEIILVDDGSIDGTVEAVQSFRDDRLRCLRLPGNIGGFQAMNLAAREARGGLVAIYHADDVYERSIVEKEVAYLSSHPRAGAVFAMYHMMDEGGTIYGGVDVLPALAGREYLTYDDVFPHMLRLGNIMFACPTFMARREVLAEVGLYDAERWDIVADVELWLRLLRRYPVGILNERLLRYRHGRYQWSQRWRHLRTAPNQALDIMELYLEQDHWRARLPPADLVEHRYQRCDDMTTRAANAVILGNAALGCELLRGRYPYRTLLNGIRRRKVRVLLLRGLMKSALAIGAARPLGRLLRWTEYRGRL